MRDFPSLLSQVRQDLDEFGVRWCLIGGLAVGARTEPRFTKDLDIAVASIDDRASEALVHALLQMGYRAIAVLEQTASGRLATVRLSPPGWKEPVIVDLLFASSGIEGEIVEGAEEMEVFPEVRVPVAGLGDLVAMKILARDDESRPQDRLDLKALLERSRGADHKRAVSLLAQIEAGGYSRGRSLAEELERTLAEFGLVSGV